MDEIKGKILTVDDEDIVRQLICQKLTKEGYQCRSAASAIEAMEKIEEDLPDLVILDITMPGKPGTELLKEIKANHPEVAVIMATAIQDISTAITCLKGGAYDYMTKPFNLEDVLLSVERALEKKRLESENKDYQLHLEQKVEAQAAKIRTAFLNAITSLAYALEAKDTYTSGHSDRVTDIAVAIAKKMSLSQEMVEKIRLAGLIHDIGKIGVKESILNKEGKLTEDEFLHVQEHCAAGDRILSPIVEDREILEMARHHHEHYDGSGYPDGLKGEDISLGARILTVADAYDAMTSERSYRKSMSDNNARSEIARCRGSQFDPKVADAFLSMPPSPTANKSAHQIAGQLGTKK